VSTEPICSKFFIVGCPRSGTTWIRSLLAPHPAVVTGDESHLFRVLYRPLANGAVQAAERRQRVLARFDARVRDSAALGHTGPHVWVDRDTLERLLDDASAAGLTGDAAAKFVLGAVVDSYFERKRGPHSRVLVEKTPGHLAFADRILDFWPEARIIEVIRDGRDVCVSLEYKSKERSWRMSERDQQIRMWVDAIRQGADFRCSPLARGRWLVVRYEDLNADMPAQIARLYAFAGIDADDDMIARVAEATSFENAKQASAPHHIRAGAVGAWRDHFTNADRRLFAELAGDVLEELHYVP
jgi:Sulfotransferase family